MIIAHTNSAIFYQVLGILYICNMQYYSLEIGIFTLHVFKFSDEIVLCFPVSFNND